MGHMPVAPPLSSLRLGSEWVLTCTGHALEEQGFLPCLHTVMIRWMDRPMSVRSHGAHGGEARTTVKRVSPEVNSGESPGHFPEKTGSPRLTLPGG